MMTLAAAFAMVMPGVRSTPWRSIPGGFSWTLICVHRKVLLCGNMSFLMRTSILKIAEETSPTGGYFTGPNGIGDSTENQHDSKDSRGALTYGGYSTGL
ncbi:hypothetical protein BDV24DRAFT_146295 [Aspergillus arachidicola]|uniref:Uncharacterized protein n=1 Tax=Aspergillus arachidicola TaxID=656916 RepID=A0A5N6XMR8_9EURO|nr:hypothetical protein BDV24DRAFT_146295 [Aspergillus arachidicola]